MPINLFVPAFHTEEILAEIRTCLDKGWTGLGFKTLEFENEWKKYTGLPNAHFLSSNTAGLHLAVKIFKKVHGWADGDEIITTPITFVSTNHAILYERLRPVFADVDDYLCLDPASVEKRITKKTRAVMFVGMGGNAGRLAEIMSLCRSKGIKLILDAAHMSGTLYQGKHAGHGADVSVFSYQAVKNLPTADSGMICFADADLDQLARKLSWLGINKDTYSRFEHGEKGYRWKYDVEDVGFKYHGNSIIASIGLVQLRYLNEDNQRRQTLASFYDKFIVGMQGVTRVQIAPECTSSRHLYQVFVDARDEIMQKHFYDHEIFPGVHYLDNTMYPMYAYAAGTCPNAALRSSQVISLPLHLRLEEEVSLKVVKVLSDELRVFSLKKSNG